MDKPKFNIMDGLIIVALVLVIAAGVFLIGRMGAGSASSSGTNTNAVFKIQLVQAEKALADKFTAAMENDETVWIGLKERFEGKLLAVEVEPSKKLTTDYNSGKAVYAGDPTCCDVTLTVKAAAVETEDAVTSGTTKLLVGEEAAIRGKDMAGFGFIIGLKTVND